VKTKDKIPSSLTIKEMAMTIQSIEQLSITMKKEINDGK
jgi:hypothetical protein